MSGLTSFYFRDRWSNEFPWLVVNKIDSPILPPIEQKIVSVPDRVGGFHIGRSKGTRTESIKITVFGDSQDDLATKKRILANWLDTDAPQRFLYSYEPQMEYQAILDGETNLDKIVADGETILTFLIPDPVAQGATKSANLASVSNMILYEGTEKGFPIFIVTFTQTSTNFDLTHFESGNRVYLVRSFAVNDRLVIDNRNGKVTLNGVLAMEYLSIISDYIYFTPGNNTININPSGKATITAEWRERFK